MRALVSSVCLAATACTPLVGDWAGPLRCGDVNEEVTFTLAWAGEAYEGEGVLSYQGQSNGTDVDITLAFAVEVEGTIGEGGELGVSAESERCTYRDGSDDVEFACVLDVDDGNSFMWDRADSIDVRGNCDGRIGRLP